jgi:hypothetical protein
VIFDGTAESTDVFANCATTFALDISWLGAFVFKNSKVLITDDSPPPVQSSLAKLMAGAGHFDNSIHLKVSNGAKPLDLGTPVAE